MLGCGRVVGRLLWSCGIGQGEVVSALSGRVVGRLLWSCGIGQGEVVSALSGRVVGKAAVVVRDRSG